jgi:ADP-ribose pyrophosphatase YjhB (NUDIX family)
MGKNTQSQKAGSSHVLRRSVTKTSMTRQFSSGGAVYKKDGGSILWLVTKSTTSDLYPDAVWRLPKGWIDNEAPDIPGLMASGRLKADEESLQKAALREVAEEGGVSAHIIQKIETIKYVFNSPDMGKILKFVTFYLMEFEQELPEGHDEETSEVAWLTFEDVKNRLSFSGEKQILSKAQELVSLVV